MSYHDEILLETLEVFINQIIQIRKVYPSDIFRKRQFLGIPVSVSIYPPVNEYIESVLKTVEYLLSEKKLFKMEIALLSSSTNEKLESYCVQLSVNLLRYHDPYLLKFEDNLRKSLLLLEGRLQHLPELNTDTRFKVTLQTSRVCYNSISKIPELCDFPWFKEDALKEMKVKKKKILPVTNIDRIGIQIHVEHF